MQSIIFNFHDLAVLLPENFLLLAICAILFIDLFLKQSQRDVTHWLSIAALVVTIALIVTDHEPDVRAFNGMYVHDGIAAILKVFILGVVATVFVYARSY